MPQGALEFLQDQYIIEHYYILHLVNRVNPVNRVNLTKRVWPRASQPATVAVSCLTCLVGRGSVFCRCR
jgi:hypothetical protein